MSRPMKNVRVLDFTAVMAGPFCTRLLADLGAEVIKVEPAEGELIRNRPPFRNGRSAYFAQLNCGKKSVVINLKSEAGNRIARDLARKSDVVVENFRPGVMKRLGLDYETLSAENDQLIYCSISGYGQTGPAAHKPAYAPIIHAASGLDLAQMSYQEGADRPARTGTFMADVLGATYAFGAIQTALLHRIETGRGQRIDVALMDAMMSMLVYESVTAQFPSATDRPLYIPLKARDGFVMVTPVSQRNFEALARALDHAEWITDPRFSTSESRREHWYQLMAFVEDWTRERSKRECEAYFGERGVPCSSYQTIAEAYEDPQVVSRGTIVDIHDRSGVMRVPNPPFKFSNADTTAGEFVADLGEHTDSLLGDLLGLAPADIAALRQAEVIA